MLSNFIPGPVHGTPEGGWTAPSGAKSPLLPYHSQLRPPAVIQRCREVEIDNLELKLQTNDSGAAVKKPSSYNSRQLKGPKNNGMWDPVAVLPPELAVLCLREALPCSRHYPAALLEITSVSLKWQKFLISIPVLWSEIHINTLTEDLLALVALFAHVSGEARLKLVLWTSLGPEWTDIKYALLPHMHRVDALILGDKPRSEVDIRGYFTFMANLIKVLDHPPSLTELDFGGRLLLDASELPILDLPPTIRVTSPIEISLNHGGFPGLFLTHFTEIEQGNLVEHLVFSNLLRGIVFDPSGEEDCTVFALNSRISCLRDIVDLLAHPSTSTERLASSLCAVFIENPPRIPDIPSASWRHEGEGNICRICGDQRESSEAIFGCIRFHFKLWPFQCSDHCAERFTSSQALREHIDEYEAAEFDYGNYDEEDHDEDLWGGWGSD